MHGGGGRWVSNRNARYRTQRRMSQDRPSLVLPGSAAAHEHARNCDGHYSPAQCAKAQIQAAHIPARNMLAPAPPATRVRLPAPRVG